SAAAESKRAGKSRGWSCALASQWHGRDASTAPSPRTIRIRRRAEMATRARWARRPCLIVRQGRPKAREKRPPQNEAHDRKEGQPARDFCTEFVQQKAPHQVEAARNILQHKELCLGEEP